MATYYEVLALPPTASAAEVEAALDGLYTKWRRLVTHHTADVRNQATQALEQLEGIRATLSDPTARAAYDAGIGLKGQIGGLADPDAVLAAAPAMAAPSPALPSVRLPSNGAATSAAPRPSLWTCPKKGCGAENPPNTKHCLQCGTQLVRECPECGKMASLVATGYCGECGVHYDVATERIDLAKRIRAAGRQVGASQAALKDLQVRLGSVRSTKWFGEVLIAVVILVYVAFFISMASTSGVPGAVLSAIVVGTLLFFALQRVVGLYRRTVLRLEGQILRNSENIDRATAEAEALSQRYDQIGGAAS